MGIKIEEVTNFEEAEEFFRKTRLNTFNEIFPPEVAAIARETFGRKDYFFVARQDENIIGAMKFSITGKVGQLDAIAVPYEFDEARKDMIRSRLLEKFLDVCRTCHRLFLWIPFQHKQAIKIYKKYGFREALHAKKFWYENDYILMVK